jgi:hypothetical protein
MRVQFSKHSNCAVYITMSTSDKLSQRSSDVLWYMRSFERQNNAAASALPSPLNANDNSKQSPLQYAIIISNQPRQGPIDQRAINLPAQVS